MGRSLVEGILHFRDGKNYGINPRNTEWKEMSKAKHGIGSLRLQPLTSKPEAAGVVDRNPESRI